jgi:hypothetical protein
MAEQFGTMVTGYPACRIAAVLCVRTVHFSIFFVAKALLNAAKVQRSGPDLVRNASIHCYQMGLKLSHAALDKFLKPPHSRTELPNP